MFKSSSPPSPQPPPPPEPPPARADPAIVQNEERDKIRRKRGRAAQILTGQAGLGDTSQPLTATKSLLGG
jgi:hypothetical protein